jgi:hypothetical protein
MENILRELTESELDAVAGGWGGVNLGNNLSSPLVTAMAMATTTATATMATATAAAVGLLLAVAMATATRSLADH